MSDNKLTKTEVTVDLNGKKITFETGRIARQAGGAVMIRQGDTMLLATACASPEPMPNIDYLPLRVDYQEKLSSTGRTPGGFIKREGKPTQNEILTSRLIDRPIRPMFDDGYHHDVQLLATLFSYDGVHAPDMLAVTACSAALAISEIPLIKPVAAVRVGFINGEFVINPTVTEIPTSRLDLVIAGSEDAVLMIEGSADFLTEEEMLKAIELGHSAIKKLVHAIHELQKKVGKPKKRDSIKMLDETIVAAVQAKDAGRLAKALRIREKQAREDAIEPIQAEINAALIGDEATPLHDPLHVKRALSHYTSQLMREMILTESVRCDGRGLKDVRTITIEQAFLPRTHGSCLFTRGETQSIAICVLGSDAMGQRYEDLEGDKTQRFYLQYFFPPYSVGEVGRIGAPGRREVGHGKLAERAIMATLPSKEAFPYTIRLESNITESNGSSSMASVCGGCLALMDAGVPIKRPVSGIAMGLVLDKGRTAILSDILGVEDALGDMDFKVCGDDKGITAFQMDIKVEGITIAIMREALHQAKEGRIHILNKMLEACPKSREKLSTYAPRIETIQLKPSKIGIVIGPGGKQIRAIVEETGVQIDIDDHGLVSITSNSAEGMERAKEIIHGLTAEAEVGKTYEGKIASIVAFGIFVEIMPGKEGLCHVSEMDNFRIENVFDYAKEKKLKEGDAMKVQVVDINDRGQIRLSRKTLITK